MNPEAFLLGDRRTISGALAERLRDAIRSGELPPGSHLRQAEIAARYDVSTTPVREAFALLQREGLVTRHENKGVVVFEPRLDDLHEAYLIRIPLEALATERAVPNLSAADFKAMRRAVAEMREVDAGDGRADRTRMNRSFHATLYRAAKLPRLFAIIDELRASSSAYMRLFGVFHPDFTDSIAEHKGILVACEQGDAAAAARLMAEHLEHTARVVSAGLESVGQGDRA